MRIIYGLCLFFILGISSSWAQPGSAILSGTVTDQNKNPKVGITIGLAGTTLGALTNDQGFFEIANIPAGSYQVIISGLGYATQRQSVTLVANQPVSLTIALTESTAQLQEVEIIGRKETSYKNTKSFAATKTETAIKDVPQAISYVTKEVIQDQQAFKTAEVVKNISGVNQFSFYDNDYSIRGYRIDMQLVNGLRTANSGWNQSLLANIERVEVIKGPASALFGNTDPGGTVNRVTKKPLDEDRKSISFTTGSYHTFRAAADFTGPMNESKSLLYRLNLAYQNAQSFRELQGSKDVLLAPSISFLPSDKTQVNFDLVYSRTNGKLDRGQPIFGADAGTNLNSTPISFALGKANDYLKEENIFVTTSLQHRFTKKINLNLSYMKFLYDEDLLEHRTSNRYAVDSTGTQIPTLMEMNTIRRLQKNYSDNITAYLVSDVKTGPLEHKLLVGYDYINNLSPVGNSTFNASGYRNAANNGAIARYNPGKKDLYLFDANGNPVPNVPHFDLVNPNYGISDISTYFNVSAQLEPARYFVNGFYLQDQIRFKRLQVLLGLRREFYNDLLNYKKAEETEVTQKAWIPRIGAVYSLTENVNAYATYVQGYQPQAAAQIGSPQIYGGPFDPLTSNMVEAGLKTELFAQRLTANVAAYRIEQNNILINANDPTNPDRLQQIGQQQARGIETDIAGNITNNLNVIASYAFNKAIITKSGVAEQEGQYLPNAPRHQGSLWAKYYFPQRLLQGLGLAFGTRYVGKRNTLETTLELPAYQVFDAAAYYRIDKFQLSVNLNNFTNKTHWVGGYAYNRLFPGTPRNFLVSVGYTF